jgi:hypothetical protein
VLLHLQVVVELGRAHVLGLVRHKLIVLQLSISCHDNLV